MTRTAITENAAEGMEAVPAESTRPAPRRSPWIWLTVLTLLAVLAYTLPLGKWLLLLSRYVEGLGAWGPAAFALIYAVTTVLLVPGTILTGAAGMIFDPWVGILSASAGSTLGAGLSFLIGRTLAREAVEEWVRKRPKFRAVDEAVGRESWKIVFLLRLSPLFPFNFLNYAFGLTRVRFRTYLTASLLGILPGTAIYVLGGSAAAEVVRRSRFDWSLLVGVIAVVLGTLWAALAAARALGKEE
ncbi:MAG: TVP38/TMEM64 family protein [Acidobacteria bacterium]|nr:TVP38/TMEM64 family protein [Acidobacteriota bacterium]